MHKEGYEAKKWPRGTFLVPVLGRGEGGNVWGTRRRRREQKWDPTKIEFS
jgi:hypothetical protein